MYRQAARRQWSRISEPSEVLIRDFIDINDEMIVYHDMTFGWERRHWLAVMLVYRPGGGETAGRLIGL